MKTDLPLLKRRLGRSDCFKCTICGRYISYGDIMDDKVIHEFTPDTQYSIERVDMTHKKCIENENETSR